MKRNDNIIENLSPDAEKNFRVPDGYFESFAKQMEEQTALPEKNSASFVFATSLWRPFSVAAAVAAAVVCTSVLVHERHEDELAMDALEQDVFYSQLEDLEIIDYLASEED